MKSRLLAGVVAALLAIVGAAIVVSYAQGADQRAVQNLDPVGVLVVTTAVPAGSTAEVLKTSVTLEQLPGTAVAKTALRNLDGSAGKVTSTDLVPGEQLLRERLIAPKESTHDGTVKVPSGLQEVAFQLEAQRVVGGRLEVGDHVGIALNFKDGAYKPNSGAETTQLTLRKVLITAVQRAPQATATKSADGTDSKDSTLPQGALMLTVAVNDIDAGKIIFASEFGTLWLTKESLDAQDSGPRIERKELVYK